MSRYWSELVNRLTPYVPGEQPRQEKLVKLNTNESPYPPTPAVLQAIAAVDGDDLRLYPDPESGSLKEAFATRNKLQADQVFIGNGSDEVLAHCFQGLLKHDLPLYFPDVSYSFYPVWCDLYEIDYRQVPLCDDFSVDITAYPQQNGGIIIPNPNAPTGIVLQLDAVEQLLRRSADSVVVIDEAYIDFGGESAASLIPKYDNLLVVQTLSKSRSLAGLRVGAAMGSAQLIDGLQRVKNSFNSYPLDVLAQRAALASLQDEAYFLHCCRRVMATREQLSLALRELGFEVLPSSANFVFARHPRFAAQQLFAALRQRGILVRHFKKPRISDYLRISIGDEQACAVLVSALQEVLAAAS